MKEILLNKKNQKVFGITILSTILFLSGLSYAYFIGSVGGSASTDVDVTTSVNERLVFTEGLPISINATLDNFSDGDGSLTGETNTNVRLNAGSQSSTATEQYQVYYQIETNNFEYSVDENTPELILTITDPEGNILTTAELADGTVLSSESVTTLVQDGLGGTTSQTVTGFDITTLDGVIILKENYTITNTNPTVATEQNWTAKITFINLDVEQTINEGKTLNSNFMLQEEKFKTITTQILVDNGGTDLIEAKSSPDFSQIADTNEGMFAAQDDYGTSYYFRGTVDNNWVFFAEYYWRILRINGDGSVRMIYAGEEKPLESESVKKIGDATINTNLSYNEPRNKAEYVGYMYDEGVQHGISTSSSIKITIDDWYYNNIYKTYEHAKVSDSLFCSDREAYSDSEGLISSSGIGNATQYFAGHFRIRQSNPILTCSNILDSFTVNDAVNGNSALTYPIGLITADEIIMAGAASGIYNHDFYLTTNQSFYSMTPVEYNGNSFDLWYFYKNNIITFSEGSSYISASGVRPVLSIASTAIAIGSGLWNDPYIVL